MKGTRSEGKSWQLADSGVGVGVVTAGAVVLRLEEQLIKMTAITCGHRVSFMCPPGEACIQLTAVNSLGTQACELFHSDDEMFWGHSVVVSTRDGGTTWGPATLFG